MIYSLSLYLSNFLASQILFPVYSFIHLPFISLTKCWVFLKVFYLILLYSILTLVLLNKLSLPHPFLTVNQSDNWMLFVISIHKLNEKQCRSWSDGFFRSHLIWIYTVFKGNAYPGSAGQGLSLFFMSWLLYNQSFCSLAFIFES